MMFKKKGTQLRKDCFRDSNRQIIHFFVSGSLIVSLLRLKENGDGPGRGSRLRRGKPSCLLVNHVNVSKEIAGSTPSLFTSVRIFRHFINTPSMLFFLHLTELILENRRCGHLGSADDEWPWKVLAVRLLAASR